MKPSFMDDWIGALEAEVLESVGEKKTWDNPLLMAKTLDEKYAAR